MVVKQYTGRTIKVAETDTNPIIITQRCVTPGKCLPSLNTTISCFGTDLGNFRLFLVRLNNIQRNRNNSVFFYNFIHVLCICITL